MALDKIINFIRKFGNREDTEELPDDVTRDKYLRSLRRERRVQMEEIEKEELKRKIEEFKKQRERRYLWGVKDKSNKLKRHALLKIKQQKLMQKPSFLGKTQL